MSKILDKNNIKKIVGIVAISILFYWILQNITTVYILWEFIIGPFVPFVAGLCIAFILNVPMHAIESKLTIIKKFKWRRITSMSLTIILFFLVTTLIMFIIIPEIGLTFSLLSAKVPPFINNIKMWAEQLSVKYPDLVPWLSTLELDWDTIGFNVANFLRNGFTNIINSTLGIASSVFNGLYIFLLGFVLAIYILFSKENLANQTKRVLYAFLPEKRTDKIISITSLANKTFSNFVIGQCTEAVILGLMFFITMSIFRFPYVLTIAVLITITALIPIFGAYIACLLGAFLILLTSPVKAFWFIIMFQILQQIEGNLIYPRVVGKSVGLPALWVMTAVLVGGSIAGIAGMLISVPLCSVLYILLREAVEKRLAKKDIALSKIRK